MKRLLTIFFILIILPSVTLVAADFGFIIDQRLGYGGYGELSEGHPDYRVAFIPRFSTLFGNTGELYVSAGMNIEYSNEEWAFLPELLRTEFSWFFPVGELRLGRMHYSDPLGIIAEGLFDGGRFTLETGLGSFSLGLWYTGLLYKNRANIAMTGDEMEYMGDIIDFGNFANTYFAPRRLITGFDFEHPALGGTFLRARLSLLAQFDLSNGENEALHSQYLTGRLSLPVNAFLFDLGGSLGFTGLLDGDPEAFYAGEFRAAWILPFSMASRLSFLGRYTSSESGNIGAFLPITTRGQGMIYGAKPSGISMLSLDYTARINRTISAYLSSSYFIRNGLETFKSYPVAEESEDGYLLGNEFFARVFWSPVSDISLNLGAGIFLPGMGNVTPDHYNRWRIEVGATLSIY
ncbi:MAG: hypothetical protein FWG77_02375 [Treponema sp.]|nr:hypothetical protein [Treponema sp.]